MTKLPLIGLLAACIVTVICALFLPKLNYQSHAIFLPAIDSSSSMKPNTKTVFVLQHLPLMYKKLGVINLERHYQGQSPKTVKAIISKAKSIAAKHGADAIVVQEFFADKPTGVESSLPSYIFKAIAIAIPTRN